MAPDSDFLNAVASNGAVAVAVGDLGKIYSSGSGAPPKPVVQFADGGKTVSERDGSTNITVTVSLAPPTPITVTYTTTGSSATVSGPLADVVLPTVKSLTFKPGQTSAIIPVKLLDDHLVEGDEVLALTLNAGTDFDLGTYSGYNLAIKDDDVYNQLPAYPNPEHRSIALAQ